MNEIMSSYNESQYIWISNEFSASAAAAEYFEFHHFKYVFDGVHQFGQIFIQMYGLVCILCNGV